MTFREQHLAHISQAAPNKLVTILGPGCLLSLPSIPLQAWFLKIPSKVAFLCLSLFAFRSEVPPSTCQLLQGRSFLACDCVSQAPGFTGWQKETFLGHVMRLAAEPKLKALSTSPEDPSPSNCLYDCILLSLANEPNFL